MQKSDAKILILSLGSVVEVKLMKKMKTRYVITVSQAKSIIDICLRLQSNIVFHFSGGPPVSLWVRSCAVQFWQLNSTWMSARLFSPSFSLLYSPSSVSSPLVSLTSTPFLLLPRPLSSSSVELLRPLAFLSNQRRLSTWRVVLYPAVLLAKRQIWLVIWRPVIFFVPSHVTNSLLSFVVRLSLCS